MYVYYKRLQYIFAIVINKNFVEVVSLGGKKYSISSKNLPSKFTSKIRKYTTV